MSQPPPVPVNVAVFLLMFGKYGCSTMPFAFEGGTVVYFITAAFFTSGTTRKTLEGIEAYFDRAK